MKGIQTTTGLGIGSIGAGVTNLLSLFDKCEIGKFFEVIPTLNFESVSSAILLIIIGVVNMAYNEEKINSSLKGVI